MEEEREEVALEIGYAIENVRAHQIRSNKFPRDQIPSQLSQVLTLHTTGRPDTGDLINPIVDRRTSLYIVTEEDRFDGTCIVNLCHGFNIFFFFFQLIVAKGNTSCIRVIPSRWVQDKDSPE